MWTKEDEEAERAKRAVESARNRQMLEKYLKDPTKKILDKSDSRGEKTYTFVDWVKNLPGERRTKTTFFRVYSGPNGYVHMSQSTGTEQKFLCVGGPLAGRKETEDDAVEYATYNCAQSYHRGKPVNAARVVLVHLDLVKTPPSRQR